LPDMLKQEIFEPSSDWTKWSKTNDYLINVSMIYELNLN